MHLLWNESVDGECLILPGKEFQIWHPEYLKDFLKRSFFGLGGTKQPDVADLRAGVLSLTCLSSKFSEI